MDYQPTNQPMGQPTNEPIDHSMDQSSSNTMWYIGGAVVIVALALWYFYGTQRPTADTESTAVEQTQTSPLSNGNTTADISSDLSQIPDDSAALNADASVSIQEVQSL